MFDFINVLQEFKHKHNSKYHYKEKKQEIKTTHLLKYCLAI